MLTNVGYALFVSPLKWAVILAPLALVFFLSFRIQNMRPATAQITFWIYAALVGVSLGSIFLIYTHTSIVRVFFITAASFGALSLWGYTTQRDLTGMGSFLLMGLFGIIIASLVNVFVAEHDAAMGDLGDRRPGVRRVDRLRHAAAEDRIHVRRDGRRRDGALRHHGRAHLYSTSSTSSPCCCRCSAAARSDWLTILLIRMTGPGSNRGLFVQPAVCWRARPPSVCRDHTLDFGYRRKRPSAARAWPPGNAPEANQEDASCRTMIGMSRPSRAPAPDRR